MRHFDSQLKHKTDESHVFLMSFAYPWVELVELQHLEGLKKNVEKIKNWHEKWFNQKLIKHLLGRYLQFITIINEVFPEIWQIEAGFLYFRLLLSNILHY